MSDKDSESPKQPNDDRNIAKVDSDTAGLTPDEQLTLIWDKYKSLVIKVAASLLIIGALWYGIKIVGARKLESIQKEYVQALQDDEAKTDPGQPKEIQLANTIAFAEKHPNQPLAGQARIKAGHAYFKIDSFEEAATHYGAAVGALNKVPELAGLAHVYQAVATYRSGNKEAGKNLLETVANNKAYLDTHRGEAYYKLGVIALSEQDLDAYTAQETAFENAALEHASQLLAQLKTFRENFPAEGFDPLSQIPEKVTPKPAVPAPTSSTGAISPTGAVNPPSSK